MVMSVPLRQVFQPGVHGVVLLDACGVDEAVHVLVPRFQSLFACLDGHVVAHFDGQRLKRLIFRVFIAILGHARHQVLTHVEVAVQEDLRPHRL